MGQCLTTRENSALASRIVEPDWSKVKRITVFGIPKSIKTELQWERVTSIDIEMDPIYSHDAKKYISHAMSSCPFDSTHFVQSLYYHLCTEEDLLFFYDIDTMTFLADGKLKPTLSFEQVCASYFETKKLLEIRQESLV